MAQVEGTKTIPVTGPFAKGFINDLGQNNMNSSFSPDCTNIRIKNGSTVVRGGTRSKVTSAIGTYIRGLVANNGNLYAAVNSDFQQIDLNAGTFTSKGTLGVDTNIEFITFGIYTIILTGSGYPFIFDGTTLTQLTIANIELGANPKYGAHFTNFTFVSGGGVGKSNILYISVGITAAAQANSYNWIAAGSEKITMKGDILGLEATLNRLYVFTDNTIEYIDKGSLSNVGGVTSFYTSPIGTGEALASHRSIVSAGEKVFYVTKDKKIKTINYVRGVAELSIGTLSDRKEQSIQGFLNSLSDDLSDTWGFFDKKDNIIKWGFKSKGSLLIDTILVYDLTNDTFLLDKGYFYSTMTQLNGKNYGGNYINSNIILDNDGKDDDGFGIEWNRTSAKLYLGSRNRKAFRGIRFAGQYNALTEINININVDGKNVYTGLLSGALSVDGLGNTQIGNIDLGNTNQIIQLLDFVKIIDKGYLNDRGYYLQISFNGNKAGQEFSLDTLELVVKGLSTDKLEDK